MSNPFTQANFVCKHCSETIYIPAGLPPTTSPCPHCGETVTSPNLEETKSQFEKAPLPEVKTPTLPEVKTEHLPAQQPEPTPAPPARDVVVKPEIQTNAEPISKGKKLSPIVLASILLLLIVTGVVYWFVKKPKEETEPLMAQPSANTQPTPIAELDPESEPVPDTLPEIQPEPELPVDDWVDIGWKRDAEEVLGGFLASRTPEEKVDYVIPNEGVLEGLETYFPEGVDEEVRLSGFLFNEDNKEDRERGIFLMHYNLPSKVSDEVFTAISNDVSELGEVNPLLEMTHTVDTSETEDPMLIRAYFKKTDEGLKLDSSIFIQGKFRTFDAFTGHAQAGKSKVFRVVISEVILHEIHDHVSLRAYKIADACYPQDYITIQVEEDSEVGEVLSVLNWRGTSKRALPRAATVELEWSDADSPELELKKVLCWEFLGVGGKFGNTALETANQ